MAVSFSGNRWLSGKPGIAGLSLPRGSFTLVEMLVVIAIIGILAALLMPGLRRALDSANGLSCRNNQRQLVSAFMMYASENNNYFPPLSVRTRTNAWLSWQSSSVAGPYFSNDQKLLNCSGVTMGIGYNNFDFPYPVYNVNVLDYYSSSTYSTWKTPWYPLTRGRNLSRLVVHTDVAGGNNAFGNFNSVPQRHGMASVSFVDGHVAALESPSLEYVAGRIAVRMKY